MTYDYLGLGDKKKEIPYNPKDPYGMNSVADDMKKSIGKDIEEFKEDYELIKKDILLFKSEAQAYVKPFVDYFKKKKVGKELKNIQIFANNVRNRRLECKENS